MSISVEEKQLMDQFKKETTKNAIWGGRITKGYKEWKQNLKKKTIDIVSQTKSFPLIDIKNKIELIFKTLDQLDQRIQLLERKDSVPKRNQEPLKFSKNHFFKILNLVYPSIEEKYGEFVLISTLTETIKQYIPWSTQEIHSELYRLFMEYQVDLQSGKNVKGEPLRHDGNIFVWFKFK